MQNSIDIEKNSMKDFVPYEPALELKQLGFDEPCFGYYVDGELRGINLGMEELGGVEPYYQRLGFHTLSNHDIDNPNKIVATAPTFSQAFKYFRESYNLHSCIAPVYEDETMQVVLYWFWIQGYDNFDNEDMNFKSYEEAELACLIKLIEIVKNK
jgi:hypothetical protein